MSILILDPSDTHNEGAKRNAFSSCPLASLNVILSVDETLDQCVVDQFLAIVRTWINEPQTKGEAA